MLHPRPHLSWSQLQVFETSEEQYKQVYFHGKKVPENTAMAFGKKVADALEHRKPTGEFMTDFVIDSLPKFELMDKPFQVNIFACGTEIPLLSKIDSAKQDLSAFYEYKTGRTPWTQEKADKHGQITFYCVVAHAITGKIPQEIELIYAPTRQLDDGNVELVGTIQRFKTVRTKADIFKMKVRMARAWKRIGQLYEAHLF